MPKAKITEYGVTITYAANEITLDVLHLVQACGSVENETIEVVNDNYRKGICDDKLTHLISGNEYFCDEQLGHNGWHKAGSTAITWPNKANSNAICGMALAVPNLNITVYCQRTHKHTESWHKAGHRYWPVEQESIDICGAFHPIWSKRDPEFGNKISCTLQANHDSKHHYQSFNQSHVW